jgi:hypothetical protein
MSGALSEMPYGKLTHMREHSVCGNTYYHSQTGDNMKKFIGTTEPENVWWNDQLYFSQLLTEKGREVCTIHQQYQFNDDMKIYYISSNGIDNKEQFGSLESAKQYSLDKYGIVPKQ